MFIAFFLRGIVVCSSESISQSRETEREGVPDREKDRDGESETQRERARETDREGPRETELRSHRHIKP